MNYSNLKNNIVNVYGEVYSMPEYSHEVYGEEFYEFILKVNRLSDSYDLIPVTISSRLIFDFKVGKLIGIEGQFRSYNKQVDNKSKLILSVFARSVVDYSEITNPNYIEVVGYVCKEPIYRTTPFNREICDILIAVNRSYNKSDYLPLIAWGRNARYSKNFKVGDKIKIVGRIQSREYIKKLNEDESITKTAYEVSLNKITKVNEDEDFISKSYMSIGPIDNYYAN